MERFISEISSVYWWIGVVTVGIIINIASSYLRRGLDIGMSQFSRTWANRKEERKVLRERQISLLAEDTAALFLLASRESNLRIRSVVYILLSTLCFGLGFLIMMTSHHTTVGSVVYFIGILSLFLAMWDHYDANRFKTLINDAKPIMRQFAT